MKWGLEQTETRSNARKRRNSDSQINPLATKRKDRANEITNLVISNETPSEHIRKRAEKEKLNEAPAEYREYIITLKRQKIKMGRQALGLSLNV